MTDLDAIREIIADETGLEPLGRPQAIGGGCINEAYRLGDYFIKTNTSDRLDMFELEKLGLAALAETATLRVPKPLCCGVTQKNSFLVLEFLPLVNSKDFTHERLGRKLARLHRTTAVDFGWTRDNFIGTTSQPNSQMESWVEFLREHRLGQMLKLSETSGLSFRGASALLANLDRFFESPPSPSLLHGDLWAGNTGVLDTGEPVIFDPAIYFGDREADLAMTRLFGGFDDSFYRSYEEVWPLPPGHEIRADLYNLYHVLNHAILFGGSYGHQAQSLIDALLLHL